MDRWEEMMLREGHVLQTMRRVRSLTMDAVANRVGITVSDLRKVELHLNENTHIREAIFHAINDLTDEKCHRRP